MSIKKQLDKIREKKHIPLIGEFVQAKLRKTGNKTKSYMLAQRDIPSFIHRTNRRLSCNLFKIFKKQKIEIIVIKKSIPFLIFKFTYLAQTSKK